jgi:hypothetical protein
MRLTKFIAASNSINGLKFGTKISESTITPWKYNLKHGEVIEFRHGYIILTKYIYGIQHGLSREYSDGKIRWIHPWVHGRQCGYMALFERGMLVSMCWMVNDQIHQFSQVN